MFVEGRQGHRSGRVLAQELVRAAGKSSSHRPSVCCVWELIARVLLSQMTLAVHNLRLGLRAWRGRFPLKKAPGSDRGGTR